MVSRGSIYSYVRERTISATFSKSLTLIIELSGGLFFASALGSGFLSNFGIVETSIVPFLVLRPRVSRTRSGLWKSSYSSEASFPAILSIKFAPPGCCSRKSVASQTSPWMASQQDCRLLCFASSAPSIIAISLQ
jgi:hypothetical protein